MLAAPALSDRLAVDVNSAAALRAKARSGDDAALRAAAKEFESMMVGIMLKTMRETQFIDKDADPFGSQTVQIYREMLDQQWARKISEGKGLGFADMLFKQLKAQSAQIVPGAEAAAAQPAGQPADGAPVAQQAGKAIPVDAASKPAGDKAQTGQDYRQAFIERLRPHAEAAAEKLGVPADFILAHAALESGWGRREIANADGSPSHNLFGIKAGSRWDGATAEVTTTEYRYGLPLKQVERFRAYGSYAEAFGDYAGLLQGRYADALNGDAKTFAFGLQQGGYATDPRYGEKLRQMISQLA
ncbi:MAG: flagellar assembly peptidoglycan hydrolase FlgJ [Hydrogenophilaceae bacterium]|nr:flagellar assembly peptidoglycan hydrolase FlgJ [Hydrogenophilaceae bacterium]